MCVSVCYSVNFYRPILYNATIVSTISPSMSIGPAHIHFIVAPKLMSDVGVASLVNTEKWVWPGDEARCCKPLY